MSNTCAERGYFEDNQPERDSEVHEILWLVTDCDDPRFGLAHFAPLPLLSEKENICFRFLVLVFGSWSLVLVRLKMGLLPGHTVHNVLFSSVWSRGAYEVHLNSDD